MSSSRIIKSEQIGSGAVGSFSFQPISHAVPKRSDGEPVADFVPMAIFDTSELPSAPPQPKEEPQKSDEPPSVTLLEEELHRRLSEAFNNGLIEGKSLAERGLVNVFRSLRTATEDVQSLREKVMRESEDDLIDLIMMVARKVVLREVTMDRGILLSVVRTAIATLSERCEITIRLNPDDYILVTSSPDDAFRKELLTERMRLKSDPAVLQGFCQIDSEMGTLDAGIDAQLDEIFRHLLEKRAMLTDNDE
jgi:flagellar assembly protein FliH